MIYCKQLGQSEKDSAMRNGGVATNTGLGNGMFQVAAAIGLAKIHNDDVCFPSWKYNSYFNGVDVRVEGQITSNYKEKTFHYTPIPYSNNMNLIGYFQSEKYFIESSLEIKHIFTLRDEFKVDLLLKYKDILTDSLSIHIRRGDYLKTQHYHPCPDITYYNKAINTVKTKTEIKNILVFSDDIDWCKNNFKGSEYIFIENQPDYLDLSLMSYCDHNIITNSSFSWWGSWLNSNLNKMIIAPDNWFGSGYSHYNTNDIYTKNMFRI